MADDDRLRELEEKYEDYKVYDNRGDKIGKVDDLFIDDTDNEEYIGVKTGLFGLKSTLIPMELVRVNEQNRAIEVSATKDQVKDAPNFDDDDDITTEFEGRIRSHFGLETSGSSSGGYGASSASSAATGAATGAAAGETTERETRDQEETRTTEEPTAGSTEQSDYDETPRAEAGDRGAEAGASPGAETAVAASQSDHDESTEDRGTSPMGESGTEEHRDDEATHGSGSEGASLGEGGGGTPVSRQTEETETFEEDGKTKIRRRIVREEVEDANQDTRHDH